MILFKVLLGVVSAMLVCVAPLFGQLESAVIAITIGGIGMILSVLIGY